MIHQSHPLDYIAFDRTMQDIVYKVNLIKDYAMSLFMTSCVFTAGAGVRGVRVQTRAGVL